MNIFFLTGLSASGKTTIANLAGEQLGIPVISLREALRGAARRSGFERTRHWIAHVGIPAARAEGQQELARLIESHNSNSKVLIDDLIDPHTPQVIRKLFQESSVTTIRIKTNRHLRKRHVEQRMGTSVKEALNELHLLDKIKEQAGIAEAIKSADLEIRNFGNINEAVQELKGILESHSYSQRHGVERE